MSTRTTSDSFLLTADTITDNQLLEMFRYHCECRPLNMTRTEDDHAAIHDCDTAVLRDIQIALGIIQFDDIGRIQAIHEARANCADVLNRRNKRNA